MHKALDKEKEISGNFQLISARQSSRDLGLPYRRWLFMLKQLKVIPSYRKPGNKNATIYVRKSDVDQLSREAGR